MNTFFDILAILTGIAVRFAIPFGFTAILVILLKRLDVRWQKEAELDRRSLPRLKVIKPQCWETKHCSLENQAVCPARKAEAPCWQFFRSTQGQLREACLGCQVFAEATIPVYSAGD